MMQQRWADELVTERENASKLNAACNRLALDTANQSAVEAGAEAGKVYREDLVRDTRRRRGEAERACGVLYREALVADMRAREEAYRRSISVRATSMSPTASPPGSPMRGFSGARPLHAELQRRDAHLEKVVALLKEGGLPPHIGKRDGRGRLAAHVAAMAGARTDILTLLVENGGAAQMMVRDDQGRIPLHYAAQHHDGLDGLLYLLSVGGQQQIYAQDAGGRLPIHIAAATNASDRVLMHLFAVGGARQLSSQDCSGRRPLHYAATFNEKVAPVRYLVEVAGGSSQLSGETEHARRQHSPPHSLDRSREFRGESRIFTTTNVCGAVFWCTPNEQSVINTANFQSMPPLSTTRAKWSLSI